jgi:energy-coupling factor transporter ATP-binding protein EcfA2
MTLAEIVTIEAAAASFELSEAAALRRQALGDLSPEALAKGEADDEATAELGRILGGYAPDDEEASAALSAVLDSLAAGEGKGGAVLITGPPGSGKSHLLGTLLLLAGSDAARKLLARARGEYVAPLKVLHDSAPLLVVPVPLNEHRGRDELLEDIVFERTEIELRRAPHNLQLPLSQHAYALELIERHVVPRFQEELDQYVRERQGGIGSWGELREVDEEAAVRVGHQFAQTIDYPLDFRQSRVERMARLLEVVDGDQISGVLYLLDDLGHFLASVDEKAMQGDCVFLEFLGHRSKIAPIWTVAALEVPLREIPGIEPNVARRISDMFGGGLPLSRAHIRCVARNAVRQAPPPVGGPEARSLAQAIEETHQADAAAFDPPSFTVEELRESYPLDPLAARCAEEIPLRLLDRADGLLSVTQKIGASGELAQRTHLQPVGADGVLEHFLPQLRSHPEASAYVREVLDYYERNAMEVAPANPDLLRRLVRVMIALRLANLWYTPPAMREALGLTAEGEAVADEQEVRDLLEAMQAQGRFVEVRRGRQEDDDVYYVEVRTALSDTLRERLGAAKEKLREDDPALMQTAVAHAGATPPLAELTEAQTVEVRWRNTARCVAVSLENLLALDELELDRRVQELSDPASVHNVHLYLAHLIQPQAQRNRWEEMASGLMGGRWAAGVLAWVPRPLSQREMDALRECAACRRTAEAGGSKLEAGDDVQLPPGGSSPVARDSQLIQRLEEEEARLGAHVEQIVRAAYYEGTVLSAFGEALSAEELGPLEGDWVGTLNAAAAWSLERIFPQFSAIAPRQFLSSREQIDALVDGFIRPGFIRADAHPRLSELVEALLLPLGLASQERRATSDEPTADGVVLEARRSQLEAAVVLNVGHSEPAQEVMRRIRARDQTPETQRGRPLACPDLAAHLLKSEIGLPPELFELLITALIRSGYLVGLDAQQKPVRLEQIRTPVSRHLQFVARPALLSYEQWQLLSRICRIVLDRAIASPGHAVQAIIWESFVAAREEWLTRVQLLRERLDRLRQRLGQPVRAWRGVMATLQHTERFFDLIEPDSYASEGLAQLLAGVEPFLEPTNGATKLRELLRVAELLDHFVDEVGPDLVRMRDYLASDDLWLPEDSELPELREKLTQLILSGEHAVGEEMAFIRLRQVFMTRYKRRYAAWHSACHRASEFEPYERLRASSEMRILAQLDRLSSALGGIEHDVTHLNEQIERELTKRCRELNLSQALDQSPVCPACGVRHGEELNLVPVEELEELAERGVAEYVAALRNPVHQQAIAHYLQTLPHRGETVRKLAEIVRLPEGAGARLLMSLLGEDVLTHLQRALSGQQIAPRSLGDLRRLLAGRTLSRTEALQLLEQWIDSGHDLGDDDLLQIEP